MKIEILSPGMPKLAEAMKAKLEKDFQDIEVNINSEETHAVQQDKLWIKLNKEIKSLIPANVFESHKLLPAIEILDTIFEKVDGHPYIKKNLIAMLINKLREVDIDNVVLPVLFLRKTKEENEIMETARLFASEIKGR